MMANLFMTDWRILLLLAAALTAPLQGASAQQGGQLWQVELIVFRHLGSGSSEQAVEARAPGTALWPPLPLPADAGSSADATDAPARPWTRFALLDQDQLQMTDAYRRLARAGAYEPVLHVGWRQPVSGQRGALAQNIPPLAAASDPSGEVTLYRRQSLHLDVNLRLPADQGAMADEATGEYRLRELRIVRGGETSYFDHPRFGVLARVFPAPARIGEDAGP